MKTFMALVNLAYRWLQVSPEVMRINSTHKEDHGYIDAIVGTNWKTTPHLPTGHIYVIFHPQTETIEIKWGWEGEEKETRTPENEWKSLVDTLDEALSHFPHDCTTITPQNHPKRPQ